MNFSHGTAGSIIMDCTALFFLAGILIHTSLYRKRGRIDDRLFFVMVVVNMVLAAADGISYLLEGSAMPAARELLIAGNIIFFTAFEVFPYLFNLYLDYRIYQSREHLRKRKLLYLIPCLLFLVLIPVNFRTGIIFSFDEANMYQSGPYNGLVFIPAGISILISLFQVRRINKRLIYLCFMLIIARVFFGVWFRGISSTAFTYTLFLVSTHIHTMNRSLYEAKV